MHAARCQAASTVTPAAASPSLCHGRPSARVAQCWENQESSRPPHLPSAHSPPNRTLAWCASEVFPLCRCSAAVVSPPWVTWSWICIEYRINSRPHSSVAIVTTSSRSYDSSPDLVTTWYPIWILRRAPIPISMRIFVRYLGCPFIRNVGRVSGIRHEARSMI